MIKQTEEMRIVTFWSRVNKKGPYPHKQACKLYPEIVGTRCWEYIGAKTHNGYGQHHIILNEKRAHRIAYVLKYGKIKDSKIRICHKCDNPSCVRTLHHFKGMQKQNAHDMCRKGRRAKHNSKLSDKDAFKIISLYSTGLYKQKDIANRYEVHQSAICRIVNKHRFIFKDKVSKFI